MSRGAGFANRLLITVVAAAALVVGVGAILWRYKVDPIRRWIDDIDPQWFHDAPANRWWTWGLAGATVLAIVIGLAILIATARPHRPGPALLAESGPTGRFTVNPKALADAAANSLAAEGTFADARAKSITERGTPLVELTVTASPQTSRAEVAAALEPTLRALEESLPAGTGLRTHLHFEHRKNTATHARVE